ncbi:MAG: phosphate ABC transporter substrate-binding protein [Elusimicrobia bacterium]|nr:phosphate ABC transporter substrate-binding protein [Elusimicrobiota bacterium]
MKANAIIKSVAILISMGLIVGAVQAADKTITIKGSDTMVILGQRWAEEYMKAHPGVVIQVTGGGSGTGISALINGSTDIAEASRPMKPAEKALVKEKHGKDVEEIAVALDGLAIYVHQSNTLKTITLAQARAIYIGQMTRWEELGVKLAQIIAYGRENNSGTYAYFKEHVLGNQDFAPEVLSLPGTAAVINAISKDKNAIGYGGIAYGKGIRALKVSKDVNGPAVAPTMANVLNGSYPISRELYFYTAGKPEGEEKNFIAWILGPHGQKLCEQVGYYPLKKAGKAAKKKA